MSNETTGVNQNTGREWRRTTVVIESKETSENGKEYIQREVGDVYDMDYDKLCEAKNTARQIQCQVSRDVFYSDRTSNCYQRNRFFNISYTM